MRPIQCLVCLPFVIALLAVGQFFATAQAPQLPDGAKRDVVKPSANPPKIEQRPEGQDHIFNPLQLPLPPRLDLSKLTDKPMGQAPDAKNPTKVHDWSDIEIWLSCAVLAFGVIAMILALVVVIRTSSCWAPRDVINLFGLILIVSGALVLVTAGYSSQQITGVIGLLGSLGGYLLGSRNKE